MVSPQPKTRSQQRNPNKRIAILPFVIAITLIALMLLQYTIVGRFNTDDAYYYPNNNNREACLADMRSHNREFLNKTLLKFWGRQDYIEVLLSRMGERDFSKDFDVFVDVGAGAYSASGGDISLSFQYDISFPAEHKTILAFEPFKDSHDALLEQLEKHRKEHDRSDAHLKYVLKNVGVGATGRPMTFRGKKNMMTANARIAGHPRWYGSDADSITLDSTTIDDEMKVHGLDHVNVLKTDTEGLEWEVLLGARGALRRRAVDLVIYAYEDKWTWDSHTAVEPVPGSFVKDQLSLDTPNLRSVSTWLDSLGYKSYLIGLSPMMTDDGRMQKGFAAIPVTGEYWDDSFEVCRDPFSYNKKRINCWMDAIAVKDGSEMKSWIEEISSAHVKVACP